jgi:Co/Zn/Cd efflux system component
MACTCQHETPPATQSPRYRRILWAALLLNATMFVVELAGSQRAGSLSLMADAIDFAGDALNYGVSLAVLGAALVWRARAAWVKAWTMMGFGAFVLGRAIWSLWFGAVPEPLTMGLIGTLALAVNLGVAALLYAFREGDANMRSVWLCSRNDAIGNLAVMGAALGVAGTGTAWPDLAVAALMATLALQGGLTVRRQARDELGHRPRAHQVVRSETTGTSGSEK